MASNPYKNKVVYDGTTLIDLTGDDVTAADVKSGKTFHLPSGEPSTGTGPDVSVTTAEAEDVAEGKVFISANGTVTVGTAGGDILTILKYGHSTWAEFEAAYKTNSIVYCRASTGTNPASGTQTRLAFMAYVNNETNPTNVEFQYYRSVNSHSNTQQGDQTYVYKLDKSNGWTVTVRENYTKIVAGTGLTGTWNNGVLTISLANS